MRGVIGPSHKGIVQHDRREMNPPGRYHPLEERWDRCQVGLEFIDVVGADERFVVPVIVIAEAPKQLPSTPALAP